MAGKPVIDKPFGRVMPELIPNQNEHLIPNSMPVSEEVRQREAIATVSAYSNVREETLREIATTLGYDFEMVRMMAERDPHALAEMMSAKASERAKAQRENPFHMADLGDMSDVSKMINGRSPDEIKDIAKTLVPADKRQTHMLLFDPPQVDGHVYGWSLVKNGDVPKKIDRGWSPVPRGPMAPEPSIACGIPNAFGIPCTKKFRTDEAVLVHQTRKHPTAYEAKVRHDQEKMDERRDKMEASRLDALISIVTKQNEAIQMLSEKLSGKE